MKRKECKQGGERGKRNKKNSASFCTGSAFFYLLPPCWSMVIFLDQWFRNDAVNNERACLHTVLLPSAHPWYDIIPWLHQTSWKGDCIPFDTNFNLLLAIDNLFIAQKGWYAVFFFATLSRRWRSRTKSQEWTELVKFPNFGSSSRPSVLFCVTCQNGQSQIPGTQSLDGRRSSISLAPFLALLCRVSNLLAFQVDNHVHNYSENKYLLSW